jgi:outer membrane protein OmpA-like peptidoglycan-associated protein
MGASSSCRYGLIAGFLSLTISPLFAQADPRDVAIPSNSPIVKRATPTIKPARPNQGPPGALPFSVENIVVGMKPEASLSKDFQCRASDQFVGFDWCQRARPEAAGTANSLTSLLRKQDGTVVYVSRSVAPALLSVADVQTEIARLTARHSEQAKIIWMPHRDELPDAVIARWGRVELELLKPSAVAMLASGSSIREGLLLDFLGDFRKSAKLGLPIYRLSGGTGYVWSASYYPDKRGRLRFVAIDASSIKYEPSGPVSEASTTRSDSPNSEGYHVPVPTELSALEDRKSRFQKLASQTIKANPKFYDYLVKKTELAGLPNDIPILRVVFEERVFFDTALWNLRPDAVSVLDLVSSALKQDSKSVVLFVAGHADNRGSDAYNMELSTKRASSVAEAIKRRTENVAIWRIGFGKAIPLRPNTTPENMAVNRRVEFIVASRLDALAYWFRDQWRYLCVGEPSSQPEFCKGTENTTRDFSAVSVKNIEIKPDITTNIVAPEQLEITLSQPAPEQTEIQLQPPPVTEVGRPEL